MLQHLVPWGLETLRLGVLSAPLPTPHGTSSSASFLLPQLPGCSCSLLVPSPSLASPVPWESWCLAVLMPGLGPLPLLPRTLYKILDSCKQLTLAQGAGEEDPGGMVTIITGLPLDNPSVLSGPMQVGWRVRRGAGDGKGTGAGALLRPSRQRPFPLPSPLPLGDLSHGSGDSPSLLLPSTGSPAGRCTCQCGHQECSGLLQAVEGDWLSLIPKPCSGADSRSLLPSGCWDHHL